MSEREEVGGTDIEPEDAQPSEGDADVTDRQPDDVDDDHVVEEQGNPEG